VFARPPDPLQIVQADEGEEVSSGPENPGTT